MGIFDIVGDIEVRQRKARYDGEPNYKRCSFVRPKKVKGDVWELVRQRPPQNFWDHPYWQYLSHEQQRHYMHRYHYYNEAPIFTEQVLQPEPPRFHRIEPRAHHAPQLIEPRYETIEPKKKQKQKKKVRIDTGHDIFESDSDTASRSSKSSFNTSKSSKSSRSGSSSSSGSTFRPKTGL